jgi:hypothetical protein
VQAVFAPPADLCVRVNVDCDDLVDVDRQASSAFPSFSTVCPPPSTASKP